MTPDTPTSVLADAAEAIARLDAARLELRAAEAAVSRVCRRYDAVFRCWGMRPESLRHAVQSRQGDAA